MKTESVSGESPEADGDMHVATAFEFWTIVVFDGFVTSESSVDSRDPRADRHDWLPGTAREGPFGY